MIVTQWLSSSQAPSGSGGIPSKRDGASGGLQRGQCPKEAGSAKGGIPGICRERWWVRRYLTYREPCVAGEVSLHL